MTLLAKSQDPKTKAPPRTLKEHIDDCLLIHSFLQQCFPKVAELSGLGEAYWDVLRTCVICHDLGKAHQEFQKVLRGEQNKWNSQRHELFSLPFVDALSKYNQELLKVIRLVVAGHHKDFAQLNEKYLIAYDDGDDFGKLPSLDGEENQDFESAFSKNVNRKAALQLLKDYAVVVKEVVPKPIHGFIRGYNKNPWSLVQSDYFKLLLLFGGLKWCDHLGSALVTQIQKVEKQDFVFLKRQQEKLQLEGFDFYEHQKTCAAIEGNLILTAPTGAGKTESAFLWLENQFKNGQQGHVFYVLPFTASINAMYKRLSLAIGEDRDKVGMAHGKLSDYLNDYFEDFQYDLYTKKDNIKSIREKYRSIVTPIKVVTPFQLLKHLFGLKGYEQGIFSMAGCYLIFDEIHAYSPNVFAQIKVLLEFATRYLQAKVMIMTATMPKFLQDEIRKSIGEYSVVKTSQKLYDDFKRHKVILEEGLLSNSLEKIKILLKDGKKVLVVCNTVKSSQDVFLVLKDVLKENEAILLHGSFTGQDRSRKEKILLKDEVKLLVGTQAIEVSLDIDYDLIFTEPAPIDALIQRFGRVNRKRKKDICDCIVFQEYNESDEYIYNNETVRKTIQALEKIIFENQGIVDEALLQNAIDFVYNDWTKKDKEKFDATYKYLSDALQILAPMLKNKHTEEDFYSQFDGIKILPQSKKEEFIDCLTRFDFITAESLKVQIRKGRYIGWKDSQNIRSDAYVFQGEKKVITIPYYITNKVYSSVLGLLTNEEEPWQVFEDL
ncbi:MAG TPA: CRISPR-associated helicase Cas3' [Saprospiraceae bacterium]|nr:CRISPR-associated helicase Cas3' [Saprospiraceae bacterium]